LAALIWERRDGQRMVFQLQGIETAIGRDVGNPIRIESTYVSKRHAVVRVDQQGYTIADLGSSNGTIINGRRVPAAALNDGDRIELGSEVLVFSNPGAGTRAPARPASRRRGVMLAVGGLAVLVCGLVLLMLAGGPTAHAPSDPGSTAPSAQTPSSAPPPSAPPPDASPAAATAQVALPGAAPALPLPSSDPTALYEMAVAHVKGQRLLEARRLLQGALRLDPANASVRERLREVDNAISAAADRHMAAGERAFGYLRYEDAIREWEQVVAMVDPADPRSPQAAGGIRRARERLVQR